MSIIERVKNLSAPILVLHIASKAIIGFGLGIVLANQLREWGGWIIALGTLLSLIPGYKILSGK